MFDGTPLPTRLRPGRHLSAGEAWQALREPLIAQLGPGTCGRLVAQKPSPDGLPTWIDAVTAALEEARKAGRRPTRCNRSPCWRRLMNRSGFPGGSHS